MKNLIIIEDDIRLGKVLLQEFTERKYETIWIKSIDSIPNKSFDYAIIDLRLDGQSGLDALDILKNSNAQIEMIILTGHGSIATTVEAMKRGAKNYLVKPASIEKIESTLIGNEIISNETENLTLSQIEHEYIEYTMLKNNNNISKTAKELGLHRQSLQRKLKKNP